MGTTISYKSSLSLTPLSQLMIYCCDIREQQTYPVGKQLAEGLLKVRPKQRSMQMEKCLLQVLAVLPANPVIQGIDVMFNPEYSIDVIKVLQSVNKQKPFRLVWPGELNGEALVYSEEGYKDFQSYDINDYDVLCVI